MPNYGAADFRRNWDKHGERPSLLDFGVADGIPLSDGAINSGDNTFTSSTAAFTTLDVGKLIWIEGAGSAGADLLTTIVSFVSANTVETTAGASTTVTGAKVWYGTDNATSLADAVAISVARGYKLEIPRGAFLSSASLVPVSNLCLVGRGYTHNPDDRSLTSSQLVCLAPVPVINYTAGSLLKSFQIEQLTLRGTSRTGSKGMYLSQVFGLCMRDVSFDYFGDHAMEVAYGVDARLEHIFAQNAMLVRTGRTAYVGVVDVLIHDVVMDQVQSSCSIGFGTVVGGQIGNGWIAGIAIRATNGTIHDCEAHLSQVGMYVAPTASFNKFSIGKNDLNQGAGLIVAGSSNYFIGLHLHANSLDSEGAYNACDVSGGGNTFVCCPVTYNGEGAEPIYNHVLHAFATTTDVSAAANQFSENPIQPGCFTGSGNPGDGYNFTGNTAQVVVDLTNLEFGGRKTLRVKGDVLVKNGTYLLKDTTGAADEKVWAMRPNFGSGELLLTLLSDDNTNERVWALVTRAGFTVGFVRFPSGNVEITGGDLKVQSAAGEIIFTDAGGTPRQIAAAYGGTGPGNGAPNLIDLLVGNSSSGWTRLAAGAGFLFTASGSGVLVYQKVDLNTPSHVSGGALTPGKLTVWDGSKLISVADGITATLNVVTLVTSSAVTLNYKDHAGANQSQSVLIGISSSTTTANFANGRWMS